MIDFKEYKDADLIEDTTGTSLLAVNNTTGDLKRIDASSIKPSTDNSVIIAEDYSTTDTLTYHYLVYNNDTTKYVQLEDVYGKIFLFATVVTNSTKLPTVSHISYIPCVAYYDGNNEQYKIYDIMQDNTLSYVWDDNNKYFSYNDGSR